MAWIVVAGSTLQDAGWFSEALELPETLRVAPDSPSIAGTRVGAVLMTPSFALAASGALGDRAAAGALRVYRQLAASLAITGPGRRIRLTGRHEHITADTSWGEGFYSVVMPPMWDGEPNATLITDGRIAAGSISVGRVARDQITPPFAGAVGIAPVDSTDAVEFKVVSSMTETRFRDGDMENPESRTVTEHREPVAVEAAPRKVGVGSLTVHTSLDKMQVSPQLAEVLYGVRKFGAR